MVLDAEQFVDRCAMVTRLCQLALRAHISALKGDTSDKTWLVCADFSFFDYMHLDTGCIFCPTVGPDGLTMT